MPKAEGEGHHHPEEMKMDHVDMPSMEIIKNIATPSSLWRVRQ